ncbi:putative threonine-rich GPI-anchored glycoprotein [Teratosphaeria destructans]|uniref:Threonine-rich GPI-anchored glycoprotein n=1 Tax=Teratosphaeria destructans TaxID=418781 RepID=A0A9W7SK02_9PEZI|nr:putative threonine-rich GPI-anchored glycoprotein [Teratosphaeria destructans]
MTDASPSGACGASGQTTNITTSGSYWCSGVSSHDLFGNLINAGRLFISQTQYKYLISAIGQISNWSGHDSNNGNLHNAKNGWIQLNDYGSISGASYNWNLRQVNNNGTIQMCGRGDTGGSTYQIYSDLDLTNNGLISFEQYFSNYGSSFNIRNPTLTTSTGGANCYNNGAVRLINVNYQQVQNVYGSGCWQLGVGSTLYLQDGTGAYQNPTAGPSLPGQSIIFQDSSAVLHMDAKVYSRNSNFGAQVFGFGSGNAIEFYETISKFSYSGSTLTVTMTSGNTCNINLGSGYSAGSFFKARNPSKYTLFGYNAIFYNGAAPSRSAPAQCSLSAPICSNLGSTLPSTTATSSFASSTSSTVLSTSSAGAIVSSITSHATLSSSGTVSSSASQTTSGQALSSASSGTATSSLAVATTQSSSTVTSVCSFTSPYISTNTGTPYYPALATSYTTDPALTATTTSGQACPTTPENGTYCGFINPEDPCAPQPDGYGPVPTPDTASAFLAYPSLHALASAAPTVIASQCNTQYQQVFRDLNGSVSAQSYLGLYDLEVYDATVCAAHCDATNLCTSFNIFAERDPSLNPSNNDSTAPTVWGYYCPNPPSMTTFKCTLWGSSIDSSLATNTGSSREEFQVVITASDGYDRTNVTVPQDPTGSSTTSFSASTTIATSTSGTTASPVSTSSSAAAAASTSSWSTTHPWGNGHNCHGKAINASPYSMGSRFFPGGYNPQVCSDFALAQNAQNAASSASSKCEMFNAVYLHKNGKPWGTYCTLYSTSLDDSYATYSGGKSGSDQYDCKQSWTWSLRS